jgi:phytoene synthase
MKDVCLPTDMADNARLLASYRACRTLNRTHGRTYFLATLLLPRHKRPYVHALYAFARFADDIVDGLDPAVSADQRAEALGAWASSFLADIAQADTGLQFNDPITPAVIDTITRWNIPLTYFEDFLNSMSMDLTIVSYATYTDLVQYMWGSAAVIGLQMLPILEPTEPLDSIAPYAIDLGYAFQLTNFLRDIGEDLHRGRVYLPQESLLEFGVDEDLLRHPKVDIRVRNLLRHEIARARALYASAWPGTQLMPASSRRCLQTAWHLYGGILDEIERADYDILDRRVSVGIRRKFSVTARAVIGNR